MKKAVAGIVATAMLAVFQLARAADLEQSLEALATQMAGQLSSKGVQKIAIDGFTDLNGFKSTLGDFVAEELTTALIANGGLEVVERRELDRVLKELSSYSDGVFDSTTTAELQKILGIDALSTWSIANLGTRIKINARRISVETAQSYAAGSISVAKDDTISYLLNQASSATDDRQVV